ncbi:MAG: decaprenyl-phosphate phosphoribosyltransferase [Acidobacteriota bacterium]|nr:decaprenyl-phosphate phosphoribosyltransferase [Acidobacteriota bacterium]
MLLPLVRSLRPVQWSKNLFVLAPLVFAGQLFHPLVVLRAVLALAVFCAAASAVYLFNDLRDREADRQHPLKRHRPLAAGTLSPALAVVAALILASLALAGSLWLGKAFSAILALYLVFNTGYSLGLKHVVILDVLIVALGFVLRVLAGSAAIDVAVSRWLALCTIFVALFLVLSKRRHEIKLLADKAGLQRSVLDHYSAPFLDQMINVVTASTVVCYALYAVSPETVAKFHTDYLIYTLPMVLFGIFRYLFLIYQSTGHRNPTETMLTDVPFLANLGVWTLAVVWIIYFQ